MSNIMKKALISLIAPVSFILILFFAPRPEMLNNTIGFIVLLIIFMFIQAGVTKFLNEKFPSY